MSDALITHAFVSPKGASPDATKIDGPKWNAALKVAGGTDGDVPVRDSLSSVGASWGTRIEVLHVNTTQQGTPANTAETDLWTYTLPAGKLNANGRVLRVTMVGTTGATANNKTLTAYVGATAVSGTGAQSINSGSWKFTINVFRSGAAAEIVDSENRLGVNTSSNATVKGDTRALAIDTTQPITFKITGTNGAAVANDILFRAAAVELL